MIGMFRLFPVLCAITAATVAVAEVGVSDNRILLGQSAALSGPAQELGIEMRLGAQLYFEHVNRQGGIFGRSIELRSYDDGYEPDRTAPNTTRLIREDGVFALFGYVGTPTSNAAIPIFSEAKVPFIGAFTGADSLRHPFNRLIFNIRASYFEETERIVDEHASLGVQSVAVFYQNDAYGKAGLTRRHRHGGAQFGGRGGRGQDHTCGTARPRHHDQRLQVMRGVHPGHETGRQPDAVPGRWQPNSGRRASVSASPRSFPFPGPAPFRWCGNTRNSSGSPPRRGAFLSPAWKASSPPR
ncbi:MAG: transporter permease [Proteobacteria bacterium]|nr:transporter permease [Pseudomonadota bacterium]